MHPLNDELVGPYVPVRVTRGALVAHRYTYAPPRCITSQYRRTYVPLSVSLWNDLADPELDGVGLAVSREGLMFFYWPKLLYPNYNLLLVSFLFFLSIGWYCEAGVFGLIGCISLSLSLALPTSFNNNNNNNSTSRVSFTFFLLTAATCCQMLKFLCIGAIVFCWITLPL